MAIALAEQVGSDLSRSPTIPDAIVRRDGSKFLKPDMNSQSALAGIGQEENSEIVTFLIKSTQKVVAGISGFNADNYLKSPYLLLVSNSQR